MLRQTKIGRRFLPPAKDGWGFLGEKLMKYSDILTAMEMFYSNLHEANLALCEKLGLDISDPVVTGADEEGEEKVGGDELQIPTEEEVKNFDPNTLSAQAKSILSDPETMNQLETELASMGLIGGAMGESVTESTMLTPINESFGILTLLLGLLGGAGLMWFLNDRYGISWEKGKGPVFGTHQREQELTKTIDGYLSKQGLTRMDAYKMTQDPKQLEMIKSNLKAQGLTDEQINAAIENINNTPLHNAMRELQSNKGNEAAQGGIWDRIKNFFKGKPSNAKSPSGDAAQGGEKTAKTDIAAIPSSTTMEKAGIPSNTVDAAKAAVAATVASGSDMTSKVNSILGNLGMNRMQAIEHLKNPEKLDEFKRVAKTQLGLSDEETQSFIDNVNDPKLIYAAQTNDAANVSTKGQYGIDADEEFSSEAPANEQKPQSNANGAYSFDKPFGADVDDEMGKFRDDFKRNSVFMKDEKKDGTASSTTDAVAKNNTVAPKQDETKIPQNTGLGNAIGQLGNAGANLIKGTAGAVGDVVSGGANAINSVTNGITDALGGLFGNSDKNLGESAGTTATEPDLSGFVLSDEDRDALAYAYHNQDKNHNFAGVNMPSMSTNVTRKISALMGKRVPPSTDSDANRALVAKLNTGDIDFNSEEAKKLMDASLKHIKGLKDSSNPAKDAAIINRRIANDLAKIKGSVPKSAYTTHKTEESVEDIGKGALDIVAAPLRAAGELAKPVVSTVGAVADTISPNNVTTKAGGSSTDVSTADSASGAPSDNADKVKQSDNEGNKSSSTSTSTSTGEENAKSSGKSNGKPDKQPKSTPAEEEGNDGSKHMSTAAKIALGLGVAAPIAAVGAYKYGRSKQKKADRRRFKSAGVA